MAQISNGNTVKVHYTGTLDDGTVFDSSRDHEPLEFTMGEGQLIPGFEAAVMGLSAGESTKVTIPPAEAYGESSEDMVLTVERAAIPEHITPEVGMVLQLENEHGLMEVTVTEITDANVTLDANHPLAGEALTFEIEVLEIL